jgi:hypothetical protein
MAKKRGFPKTPLQQLQRIYTNALTPQYTLLVLTTFQTLQQEIFAQKFGGKTAHLR